MLNKPVEVTSSSTKNSQKKTVQNAAGISDWLAANRLSALIIEAIPGYELAHSLICYLPTGYQLLLRRQSLNVSKCVLLLVTPLGPHFGVRNSKSP